MNPLIDENDIRSALFGRKIYLIFRPPRRQFYIDSIRRIMEISQDEFLNFTCILIPPTLNIAWSKRSRIEREVFENSSELLQKLQEERGKFRFETRKAEVKLANVFKIFLRPNKNLEKANELYNSVLSIVLAKQWIPEYSKKLPIMRFYKTKILSALDWHSSYEIAKNTIDEADNPLVIFINGRIPYQAAIRKFCEVRGLDFLVLEQGNPKNVRFHLQPFQPQETESSRRMNELKLNRLLEDENSRKAAENWSVEWMANQKLVRHNKFAVWDSRSKEHQTKDVRSDCGANNGVISFFNSSLEERFTNMGMEMNGWSNQSDAISTSMKVAKVANYKTVLRFHPNYLRKNLFNLFYLTAKARAFADDIFFPWDSVSTPKLIQNSVAIVTWGSTVSLESTFKEIPTVLLGRTTYDNLIDVSVHNPKTISRFLEYLITPNSSRTASAAYIAKNVGFELNFVSSGNLLYIKRKKSRLQLYLDSARAVLTRGLNATPQDFIVTLRPILGAAITIKALESLSYAYSIVLNLKSTYHECKIIRVLNKAKEFL